MGGKSSTLVETVNTSMTDVIISMSKTCASASGNLISVDVGSVAGDVVISGKQTQTATSSIDCDQKSDLSAAIKSEMMNAIRASSAIQNPSIFEGSIGIYTESKTRTKTVNETIMNMNIDDLIKCSSATNNDYIVKVGTVGGKFTFNPSIDQNANGISKCIQASGIDTELANAIKNDIEATSKQQGLAGTMFDGMGNIMSSVVLMGVVAAVFALVIFIAWRMLKGKPAVTAQRTGFLATLLGTATSMLTPEMAGKLANVAAQKK